MKKITIVIISLLALSLLLFSGCTKKTSTQTPATDISNKQTTAADTSVNTGVSEVDNLTSIEDPTLDSELGNAGQDLQNW